MGGLPGGPGAALCRLAPAVGPDALGRRAQLRGSCRGPGGRVLARDLVGASLPGGADRLRLPLQAAFGLVTLFGPASKRIPLAEVHLSSIQQAALMLHQEVILQVKRCPVMTSSHWQAILEASSRSRNWSIHMRFLMMLGVTIRAVQLRLMTDFEGADSQDF